MTEEQKAHLSAMYKGKPRGSPSIETRAKMSVVAKNRNYSPETRERMSAAHKGLPSNGPKHHTPETKAKISAAKWKGGPPVYHRKQKAKRRALGFIPLNLWFAGSDGHHIDREHVIYIPRELHQSVRHNVWNGRNMKEINDKAFAWLSSQVVSVSQALPSAYHWNLPYL